MIKIEIIANTKAEYQEALHLLTGGASKIAEEVVNPHTAVESKPEMSHDTSIPATQMTQTAPVVPVQNIAASSTVVPTTAAAYTFDQLAAAAAPLMDAGKGAQLIEILHAFGVDALTSLAPESYGAFATKMRELGAKI